MRTLIIAEAGVNHNGSMDLAKKLVDVAAEAGADFVKFQTFKAEKLVSKDAKKATYQSKNLTNRNDYQFEMLKKLELDKTAHLELIDYCKHKEIQFLSTGFDEESVDLLENIGVNLFKIPSGEITNKPYLQYISNKGKPVIMSTGMANMSEIKTALDVLITGGLSLDMITILHCNTEYPTPYKDVNLKAMVAIRDTFNVKVGYSDHTMGIEVPIAAITLGATVIEKHFTLDRNLPGPDHKASLEPEELKAMVKAIRNVELAIKGNGIKEPSESEKPNIIVIRKSIHLNQRVLAGTTLTTGHLIMKRPGNGISPLDIDKVIGRTLTITLEADSLLSWEHFEK